MVAASTLVVIVLNLILGLIIPAALYLVMRKKFGKNPAAFFVGCSNRTPESDAFPFWYSGNGAYGNRRMGHGAWVCRAGGEVLEGT